MSVVSRQSSVAKEERVRQQRTTDHGPRTLFLLRRAITLTEVLIAMGILTVGLLGVASIFPVASYYMQRAEVADTGSAVAQSVMSDIVARGMLNPRSWYVIVPPASAPPQGTAFPSDGKYTKFAPAIRRGTYSRPFAPTLLEAFSQPTVATNPTIIGKQFGSAFVIDPLGVASMAFPDEMVPTPSRNGPASTFPATGFSTFGAFYPTVATSPWSAWNGMWPIRRVTFRQSSTGWQLDGKMAEHYFRGHDDLTIDHPDRDDRPAQQLWEKDAANSMPLARQWAGDYSWIVCVVPTTTAARDGIARNPEGFSYEVSVVVFYKRALPPGALAVNSTALTLQDYLNTMGANERAVKATVISTGLNGGELLIEDLLDAYTTDERANPAAFPAKSPFQNLKVGEWIMLCGPHPNSTADTSVNPPIGDPRFVMKWYQVVAIESNANGIVTNSATQRLITVRGPQWPWEPEGPISNDLCVSICRGAVAVHSKTLRLENPHSSAVSFGEAGSPQIAVPPHVVY